MIIVLMGVSGAGKSTIAKLLSERLGWSWVDADDLHASANVEKMSTGLPLTDDDRASWLRSLRHLTAEVERDGRHLVLACSALKERFRARLGEGADVRFVYLRIDASLAAERVGARLDHFMPADLVPTQFAALEEPSGALLVDASRSPESIVQRIVDWIGPEHRNEQNAGVKT